MGIDQSPGHGIEAFPDRMNRVLNKFEGDNSPRSLFHSLAEIIKGSIKAGASLENIAQDSVAQKVLIEKIPDLVDRDLLAAEIYNKYLYTDTEAETTKETVRQEESEWRKKFNAAAEEWEKSITQGVNYKPYVELHRKLDDAELLYEFITAVDTNEIAKQQETEEKQARDEERTRFQERAKKEETKTKQETRLKALEIFENYKIKVPTRQNEEELSEPISMKEYAKGIALLRNNKERSKRIEHLSANLKFAFSKEEIIALTDYLSIETKLSLEQYKAALNVKEKAAFEGELTEGEKTAFDANIQHAKKEYERKLALRNIIREAINAT